MYFRTEGVVLKKRNFGEADRILTIYTRDHGKLSCIAKGVRRPRSRKAGHLELGNWCKVFIARGKNIDLLTEVELKKTYGFANFSESKTNRIYHLLEIVEALTSENQKNPLVFKLLINFLSKIEKENNFDLVSSVFKVKLLSQLGFFSAHSFTNSKAKYVLDNLETNDFESVKQKIILSQNSYLKLLKFLDSMIENITQSKLKTSRFL